MDMTEKPSKLEYSWLVWDDIPEEEIETMIYTDGACNDKGAGYAIAVFRGNDQPLHTENGPLGKNMSLPSRTLCNKSCAGMVKI